MTRDEAIEECVEAFEMSGDCNSGELLNMGHAEGVIDKIYDDFESRTCLNCKSGNYRPDGGNTDAMEMFCGALGCVFSTEFGCNHFRKKE